MDTDVKIVLKSGLCISQDDLRRLEILLDVIQKKTTFNNQKILDRKSFVLRLVDRTAKAMTAKDSYRTIIHYIIGNTIWDQEISKFLTKRLAPDSN